MTVDNANLAALVGSRICHDLISPVGAINNGLELLGMAGAMDGPELELISDSVNNANARIRFFRIAFGAAGEQELGRAEVISVLEDLNKGGRVQYNWSIETASLRKSVRLAFLAGLCLEAALPYGGSIQITYDENRWLLVGTGRRINIDELVWESLVSGDHPTDLTPALVQFAMLPQLAAEAGRKIAFEATDEAVTIKF